MKLIILNHKMNLYYNELNDYINSINKIPQNFIIAPSNIYLIEFIKKCNHQTASQDICYIEDGNHTGKVSWSQIKSLGIKYSLIGHSEKNDDINKINKKIKACLDNKMTPILCFGNQNKEESPIEILKKINILNNNEIIYAYEPIFNIGNDNIDIKYIEEQINQIYDYLFKNYHYKPIILYGGGINNNNINQIYNINKISGIILGSISSNIKELEKILSNINEK